MSMVTAGIISGGLSLVSGIFGASSAKRRARAAARDLEEIRTKSKEYENAILEGINCRIGK